MSNKFSILALSILLATIPLLPANSEESYSDDLDNNREILVQLKTPYREDLDEAKNRLEGAINKMRSNHQYLLGKGLTLPDFSVTAAYDNSFIKLTVPEDTDIDEFITKLKKDPELQFVEPNSTVYALSIPNDQYYQPYQWNLQLIQMPKAWDAANGEGATVAVVDSGIAYENYGMYRRAPDFNSTDFLPGYDFINRDTHPNDDFGHGTHITGIIASATNNFTGIAGIAPKASIMPIKILNSSGQGSISSLAEGIRWAADNNADIINLSVGTPNSSDILKNAIKYAYDKGVTLISAVGNDGAGNILYPAAYHEYVIAVGGSRADGQRAHYSNTGNGIDLLAPGGDFSRDDNNDGYSDGVLSQTFTSIGRIKLVWSFTYNFAQGTSVAVPHVSGVAALMASLGIDDPSTLRSLLQSSATDLETQGWDPSTGYGLLNAEKAVQLALLAKNNSTGAKIVESTINRPAPSTEQDENETVDNPEPDNEPTNTPANTEQPPTQESGDPNQNSEESAESVLEEQNIEKLNVTLDFIDRFGRPRSKFLWWDSITVKIHVTDEGDNPVPQSNIELRYRLKGSMQNLNVVKVLTDAYGLASVKLGKLPRRSIIEVGVVATKNDVNSGLIMGEFTIR